MFPEGCGILRGTQTGNPLYRIPWPATAKSVSMQVHLHFQTRLHLPGSTGVLASEYTVEKSQISFLKNSEEVIGQSCQSGRLGSSERSEDYLLRL